MASGSRFSFSSGSPRVRHISQASNDLDSEIGSAEYSTYTVHIPPTPDNQPTGILMQRSTSQRLEDQYASSSLFTGGYNCVTRAQLKEKVIESETSHPQMTGAQGSYCAVEGCDAKVVTDERGDAIASGESICPGCKQPYKEQQLDMTEYAVANRQPLSLPSTAGIIQQVSLMCIQIELNVLVNKFICTMCR
ncbi:cellulose synthase-like protein D3 [Prunus yedoensis var. nudiflora]|uniref:Cellulose synthase-like protein D3 n=1 Tax=Prunus yedoensis var. nudiflora TaxID=2094558 RepID=A0A314XSE6_PRUYE|nr:cellulose synthase-like protein D3 [Prunus yedoensis var. nudiflora]